MRATGPSQIREALTAVDIAGFIATQKRSSRSGLDAGFVRHWAEQYRQSESILKRLPLKGELAEALTLFREVAYPMAMLERSAIPSYYPYTCVNILDWYMGDCGEDLIALKAKTIPGILALLLDIGRFEMQSLIGCEPFQALHFRPELAISRIELLRDVYDAVKSLRELIPASSTQLPVIRAYDSIIEYANEPLRISALVHFSCLPQTQFHDEPLFLRSIHISELCFYGIRISVAQAKDAIRRDALTSARKLLEQALGHTEILLQTFRVLRTMPPEHFHDFRASAANASAVQSANYQTMDIHLFGFSEHKRALFQRIPHLRQMQSYDHPGFCCLRDELSRLQATVKGEAADALLQIARKLDRKLLKWRGLHVGFARTYLSDAGIGTGGTSGASYLKLFLKNTLFGDTRLDDETAYTVFEPPAVLSNSEIIRPGMHIAPARELIDPDNAIVTEPPGDFA
ncbi:MAG TPA: tryptophan 2,3-dioxygenase family protein [Bryobacteraceae bacterium]|nr:tryptophan 2,3-dioxygenase family protein [Bryobacteraceae bacterium]